MKITTKSCSSLTWCETMVDKYHRNRKWFVCKESVGWSLKSSQSKTLALIGKRCQWLNVLFQMRLLKWGPADKLWWFFQPRPTWAPSRPSLILGMLVCVVSSWLRSTKLSWLLNCFRSCQGRSLWLETGMDEVRFYYTIYNIYVWQS